ncbi:MAG TPA: hypothetical protein VF286_11070 [Acidiphilium sp.]
MRQIGSSGSSLNGQAANLESSRATRRTSGIVPVARPEKNRRIETLPDVAEALEALATATPGQPVTIADALFDLIRPTAPERAIARPARLAALLDAAIAALDEQEETRPELTAFGASALRAELQHHRMIMRRRADDGDAAG